MLADSTFLMNQPTRSEFLQAYQDTCSKHGTRYLDIIPNKLYKEEEAPVEKSSLELQGNQLDLFEHRLCSHDIIALSEVLSSLQKSVQELNLSYNHLDDTVLPSINTLLDDDAHGISMLDLAHNNISEAGAIDFVSGLDLSTTLKDLRLEGNAIGPRAGKALSTLLETNACLTALSLADTEQNVESIVALVSALRGDSTLKKLNLSNPRLHSMSEDAITHVALMLQDNRTLEDLNLSKFQLSCHTSSIIFDHLASNKCLTSLDLSCNRIAQDGASALAKTLQENCSIQSLNLQCNRIRTAGALSLAVAISNNTTLKFLNLQSNGIDDEGLAVLGKASLRSPTMETLHLWGNYFGNSSGRFYYQLGKATDDLKKLKIDFIPYVADGEERVQIARK